jgi:hypothetical protein
MRARAAFVLASSMLLAAAGGALAVSPSDSPAPSLAPSAAGSQAASVAAPSASPGPSGSASPSASLTPSLPPSAAPSDTGSVPLLTGAASPAAAGPVRVLSGDYGLGVSLALDPSGHRHVVASRSNGDLWYATDRSGAWQSKRILRGQDGNIAWARPSVATDDAGRVHIAVVREAAWDVPGGTDGIYYLTDAGRTRGTFGTPARIAGRNMTGPSLRILDGVRYLAYFRCLCTPVDRDATLSFKTDRGGSWTTERVADYGVAPSLRVDPAGRPRIVFQARNGLRYVAGATRRGGFGASERVPASGQPDRPSLALDSAGAARLTWISHAGAGVSQVLYAQRSASGWSNPRILGPGHDAALSIDASDRPHVAIAGQRLRHRWLADGAWQARVLTGRVEPSSLGIRAFDRGASIAWRQNEQPRGVYVTRD